MNFDEKFGNWTIEINDTLGSLIEEKDRCEENIYRAMRYSLLAGGKRLRPVLALAVGELLGCSPADVMPFGCAIEMIHTYSLIHDDLPAMDNDDYRRGRLTNHKVFGEAMAVLAGDGLLNFAFEVMLEHTLKNGCTPGSVKAMQTIAVASGTRGMIGGQVVDMESEGKSITPAELHYMHKCKTGAIIRAAVLAPADLSDTGSAEYQSLTAYAEGIGLAFQIRDDILDVEGSFSKLGKQTGCDSARGKSTFITLYGLDESRRMLSEITEKAVDSLTLFGEKADFLKNLAWMLAKRDH